MIEYNPVVTYSHCYRTIGQSISRAPFVRAKFNNVYHSMLLYISEFLCVCVCVCRTADTVVWVTTWSVSANPTLVLLELFSPLYLLTPLFVYFHPSWLKLDILVWPFTSHKAWIERQQKKTNHHSLFLKLVMLEVMHKVVLNVHIAPQIHTEI